MLKKHNIKITIRKSIAMFIWHCTDVISDAVIEAFALLPCSMCLPVMKIMSVLILLGILDKNRDTFSADLHQVIAQSYCKFLLHLFEKELKMVSSFLNECIYCLHSVGKYLLIGSNILKGVSLKSATFLLLALDINYSFWWYYLL